MGNRSELYSRGGSIAVSLHVCFEYGLDVAGVALAGRLVAPGDGDEVLFELVLGRLLPHRAAHDELEGVDVEDDLGHRSLLEIALRERVQRFHGIFAWQRKR